MTEIRIGRTRCDHQKVEWEPTCLCGDDPPRSVDTGDFRHEDGDVFLFAQNVPDRPRDLGGRERGSRNLVKQRLKTVIVVTVYDSDIDRHTPQRFRCLESAEARSDDNDLRTPLLHGCGFATRFEACQRGLRLQVRPLRDDRSTFTVRSNSPPDRCGTRTIALHFPQRENTSGGNCPLTCHAGQIDSTSWGSA